MRMHTAPKSRLLHRRRALPFPVLECNETLARAHLRQRGRADVCFALHQRTISRLPRRCRPGTPDRSGAAGHFVLLHARLEIDDSCSRANGPRQPGLSGLGSDGIG